MLNAFSFSYTPKPSTALASITPLKLLGEGREALRFTASTPMSFIKQNPEVVTEGFWKGRQALTEGIVKGTTSALSGITGALTQKAADAKAVEDAKTAHDRAVEIARIKSAPTENEEIYKSNQLAIQREQLRKLQAENNNVDTTQGDVVAEGDTFVIDEIESLIAPAAKKVESAPPIQPVAPTGTTAPSGTPIIPAPAPAPSGVSQRSFFGRSNNPNFVAYRDAFKNRSVASAPTEPNLFSDISAITPVAEDKPLAGTPPVEPALPQAVPSEPALATPEPVPERTQEEIINQYVGLLTNKAYRGAGDARRAKQVLEKLGLKSEIEVEKGEKGSRLHYVKVVDEAPAAKTAPEGYFTESIRDADGKETYVYKPKIPAKQQIATFDSNIEKAKVLQETLKRIQEIAPGYLFAGAGGISGLMKYNPIANDARTTRSLLDTVKGIVGFDELVALKQQGGSLGALSDSELKMLTSLKGSIDPDMDEKTFMDNIKKMSESTKKLITGLEADKKDVMNVEKKTNFQPIQSQKTNKKGDSFIFEGNRYVHDGTKFVLTK